MYTTLLSFFFICTACGISYQLGQIGCACACAEAPEAEGGLFTGHQGGSGEPQHVHSQTLSSEGTQTPRSIMSGLERQPSSSTVKSVKFAGQPLSSNG